MSTGSSSNHKGPKPKSDFGEFSGNPQLLRTHLLAAEINFAAWAQYLGEPLPEQVKAMRLGDSLRGRAQKHYLQLVQEVGISDITYGQVKSMLETHFPDITEAQDARRKLASIKQGPRQSVQAFAAELKDLLQTPGLEKMQEDTAHCIFLFREGLHEEIQRLLIARDFTDLESLVEAAVLAEVHAQKMRRSARAAAAAADAVNALRLGRDDGGGRGGSGGRGGRGDSHRGRGGGRHRGRGRGRGGGRSWEEYKQFMLCFGCKQPGHMLSECPHAEKGN